MSNYPKPSGEGRKRVVIEGVTPEIDCGHFPAKRTIGEVVTVEADVFTDGHDAVCPILLYKKEGARKWATAPMAPLVNDRWQASFTVEELGCYRYTLQANIDHFATWQRDLAKRIEAAQDVSLELLIGAGLLADTALRAKGTDVKRLQAAAGRLADKTLSAEERAATALDPDLALAVSRHLDEERATRYVRDLAVWVDRGRARFGTWYEVFPRSTSPVAGHHGTFLDLEAHLPYIAKMGFDVVYLPPVHPVGHTKRKGKNNTLVAGPDDPGSPWAIGSEAGGHKAIEPRLGTLEDFRRLVESARSLGMEIALDIAYQCSPDHPYVKEHPEWFRKRPDGTIQYAENPPKKYEDIYPFDFEAEAWPALWQELLGVIGYWIDQGVSIFRVDNPHTKALPFWEWAIAETRKTHPDVIFLAEAFTRPKLMYRLAKLGFTQSYNYFPWRNAKWELTEYFTELTQTQVAEYFRPNLWPNTPDILTEFLQHGGRPAFLIRLALAATLGASYGIYGPAFELMDNRPLHAGSEEYLDSEKYQIRRWDLESEDSLRDFITIVNHIRRENPALQTDRGLRFHHVANDQLICYSKRTPGFENVLLMVVNLSPHHTHAGWIDLDMGALGLEHDAFFQVHDLVADARYGWQGSRNYVELNPHVLPAHIFRIVPGKRLEDNFEYY